VFWIVFMSVMCIAYVSDRLKLLPTEVTQSHQKTDASTYIHECIPTDLSKIGCHVRMFTIYVCLYNWLECNFWMNDSEKLYKNRWVIPKKKKKKKKRKNKQNGELPSHDRIVNIYLWKSYISFFSVIKSLKHWARKPIQFMLCYFLSLLCSRPELCTTVVNAQ